MLQRRGLTEITEAWSYENNAVQIYPFIRLSENEGPTRALVWIYVLAIGILRVSRTWRTLEMRPPSQKILWTEKILLVLPFSKPKAEADNTYLDLDYSGYHKNLIQ